MTNIKERVLYISDYYKIKKETFFNQLGLSYANFKGIQKKTSLSSDSIDRIMSSFPEVNPGWLITGKGKMLLNNSEPSIVNEPPLEYNKIPMLPEPNKIPYYETDVTAGDVTFFDEPNIKPDAYMEIPGLVADAIVRVKGHSMHDVICNGDWVALRKITDFSFFNYGLKYLVVTGEQRLVKYLRKHEDKNYLLLTSHNAEFDSIDMPIEKVLQLFLIVEIFKHEAM